MLAMIEQKTEGNLTTEEATLIKRVLYQLRMNYVDELKSDEKSEKDAKAEETPVSETGSDSDSEGDADDGE